MAWLIIVWGQEGHGKRSVTQCLGPFCFQKKKATVALPKVSALLHVSAVADEDKTGSRPFCLLLMFSLCTSLCGWDVWVWSGWAGQEFAFVHVCVQKKGLKGRTAQSSPFPLVDRKSKAQANPLFCRNAGRWHARKWFQYTADLLGKFCGF